MPEGDLITADWEMEFNGLLLGGDSPYSIARIEGLLDQPETRSADRLRLRRHGMIPGDDFLGGRSVTVTLEVFGEDDETFASNVEALALALVPGEDEAPLVFQLPGVAGGALRRLGVRPRRRSLPIGLEFFYRMPLAVVEFVATDPRIYSNDEESGTSELPTAGGGLNFPATFPLLFGAVATGGTITAVNSGTFSTAPSFRIDGPVTNPRIENVTAGQTLALDIELAADEFLEIDADERTVLLGGTASRYSALTSSSEWFELAPGSNEITFRASTSSAAELTMTWRSAWV